MPLTFITGPVRSGKSRFAVSLAARESDVVYVATAAADIGDAEWNARIARHREERPAWPTLETATFESDAFVRLFADAPAGRTLLVDSLGTWLGNELYRRADTFGEDVVGLTHELDDLARLLADALLAARANLIVVAEETGWGIVPSSGQGRVFRDVLGRLTQRLAPRADRAYLVISGIAIDLAAVGIPVQ